MTVSVGLEHGAIGVGRDDQFGVTTPSSHPGGLRAAANEVDDLYVTHVGARPLAPTKRTDFESEDLG